MSVSRHCSFYKSVDGKWYMELAHEEYAGREDATTYGPFLSEEAASKYLHENYSNPGGSCIDESGTEPVPLKSPNGDPVQVPHSRQQIFGYGRRRW